jgi:hypothetical protein
VKSKASLLAGPEPPELQDFVQLQVSFARSSKPVEKIN